MIRRPHESEQVFALRQRLEKCSNSADRKLWNGRLRSQRLKEARDRGTHTDEQWRELVARFDGRCVRCGCTPVGGPCKDHIEPIYLGGSDAIDNLQPLCRECNSSKTADTTNWVAYRDLHGFLEIDKPEPRF